MFPRSVEPRAKMKNTSLQAPDSSSVDVEELWRASSVEGESIGALRTGVVARA